MKKIMHLSITLCFLLTSSLVFADKVKGKAAATTCTACHGANGKSANDLWPNLAGQKKGYIMKQLKAFQAGDRKDPLMSPMAKPLSPEDIENIADYFSQM